MSNSQLPPIQPNSSRSSFTSETSSLQASTQPRKISNTTTVAGQTLRSLASSSASPPSLAGRTVTPQKGFFSRAWSWIARGFSRFVSFFLPTGAEQASPPPTTTSPVFSSSPAAPSTPVPAKNISTSVAPDRALAVLSACAARIRKNLDRDGLFRVAGAVATVDARTREINQQGFTIETVQKSVADGTEHEATDLLKRVVEGMQQQALASPVVPRTADWIARVEDNAKEITRLRGLIAKLPDANQQMMQILLSLCRDISDQSATNKMTVENLALLLPPRLFPDYSINDAHGNMKSPALVRQENKQQVAVIEFMINNYNHLFPTPIGQPPFEPAPALDQSAIAVDLSSLADSSDARNAIARARRAILDLDPGTRETVKLELQEYRQYIDESADREAAIATCAEILSNLIYDPNNAQADAASKRGFAQLMIEHCDDLFPEETLMAPPSEPAPAPVTETADKAAFKRWLSPNETSDVSEQGLLKISDMIKNLSSDQKSKLKDMLQKQNRAIADSKDKESAIQHGIDEIQTAFREKNSTREIIAQQRGIIRFMLENYDQIFDSSD